MRIVSQQEFLSTPAGDLAKQELQRLVHSSHHDTAGAHSPANGKGLAFVDRHLAYLVKHPNVSSTAYLSNLRVMTKLSR